MTQKNKIHRYYDNAHDTEFVERHVRKADTVGQRLAFWMALNGGEEAFLHHSGLAELLPAGQYVSIKRGDAPIGKNLKEALSFSIPDAVLHADRSPRSSAPPLEISDEALRSYKARVLLCVYMGKESIVERELGEICKLSRGVIQCWRSGETAIPDSNVGDILKTFNLPVPRAREFALAVNPAFEHSAKWLKTQIAAKNWDMLNHPALDGAWLDTQPRDKQAGLLIRNLREKKNMTLREFASEMKTSSPLVHNWEQGKQSPVPKRIDKLAAVLGQEHKSMLEKYTTISRQAMRERNKFAKSSVSLGGTISTKTAQNEGLLPEEKQVRLR